MRKSGVPACDRDREGEDETADEWSDAWTNA